jgi:hypothetical protein
MNDWGQWYRIARLNRLSDPMITGTMTLLIPDPDPSTTGGVPQINQS